MFTAATTRSATWRSPLIEGNHWRPECILSPELNGRWGVFLMMTYWMRPKVKISPTLASTLQKKCHGHIALNRSPQRLKFTSRGGFQRADTFFRLYAQGIRSSHGESRTVRRFAPDFSVAWQYKSLLSRPLRSWKSTIFSYNRQGGELQCFGSIVVFGGSSLALGLSSLRELLHSC